MAENKKLRIAIDGPSGSGKSTLAKALSKKLGVMYLDTGALYRAVGLKALELGVNTKNTAEVEKILKDINIYIKYIDGEQKVYIENECVNEKIRTPEVSVAASDVSAMQAVRMKLLDLQKKTAANSSVVMDGRDIGTCIIPDAEVKIFLVSNPEERAKRRLFELEEKGVKDLKYESVLSDIMYRDKQDSQREFAPLRQAPDAVCIDNSILEAEETLGLVLKLVEKYRCKQ